MSIFTLDTILIQRMSTTWANLMSAFFQANSKTSSTYTWYSAEQVQSLLKDL